MEQTRLQLLNNPIGSKSMFSSRIEDILPYEDDVGDGWVQEIPWPSHRRPVFSSIHGLKHKIVTHASQAPRSRQEDPNGVPDYPQLSVPDYKPQIIDIRPLVDEQMKSSFYALEALRDHQLLVSFAWIAHNFIAFQCNTGFRALGALHDNLEFLFHFVYLIYLFTHLHFLFVFRSSLYFI